MFKLKVVAGPNSGQSFELVEGENVVGRQSTHRVVLATGRVSKRHCVIEVNETGYQPEVRVRDEGSANGTFVNGALVKTKSIQPGDKLSVGEFVLQLVEVKQSRLPVAHPTAGVSNVIAFPSAPSGASDIGLSSGLNSTSAPPAPTDLKSKVSYVWDQVVMPFFYNLNLTHEWRGISVVLMIAIAIGSVFVSVQPVIITAETLVVKEIGKRARDLARQLVDLNAPLFAAQQETKSSIYGFDKLDGVRQVVLTDLDNRIVAPASKINQMLTSGPEAFAAVKAKEAFKRGVETGGWFRNENTTVVAVEPIKLLNPTLGRNVIVGMAVVSIDSTLSTPALSEISMFYSQGVILAILITLVGFAVVYRLTLRPFVILNEDLDRVLKGEMGQVTHEYKFEELNSLWEIVNALCQRAKGLQTAGGKDSGPSITVSEFEPLARALGAIPKQGVVLCDSENRITFMNSHFEELTGTRGDRDMGQVFSAVAREQSLEQTIKDLFARTGPGSEAVTEDYEFNGVGHKITAVGFGVPGGNLAATLFIIQRTEG